MAQEPASKPSVRSSDLLDRGDARWAKLHSLILHHSLKLGDFILSSGRRSKFLFQLRQTTMLPEGQALIAQAVLEYMRRNQLRCIGGLELGAIPLVSAVSVVSHGPDPVSAFFVRKAAKSHGARERIDGHILPNSEVVLIDDVATTGQSFLTAIEGIHAEFPGCFVKRAIVVVDREEGAAETLAARNIELVSAFKKSDFPIS